MTALVFGMNGSVTVCENVATVAKTASGYVLYDDSSTPVANFLPGDVVKIELV